MSWCAGISLLDQLTSGQVIVYVVAVISIAITPFYEPLRLFLLYLAVHSLFITVMPYFQESTQLLYQNSLNTTTFVIMSWAISFMRYKKQAEDFNNKKIILKIDEFVILLPYTDKENALNIAEQMRKGVEEKSVPHLYSGVSDHVTISLGINTIIPSDESSIDEFISNTDKALYMAKKRRNCPSFAICY